MHNNLPVFAATHFILLLFVAAAIGSDKPNNSYNGALTRVTKRESATINQKTRSEWNMIVPTFPYR